MQLSAELQSDTEEILSKVVQRGGQGERLPCPPQVLLSKPSLPPACRQSG